MSLRFHKEDIVYNLGIFTNAIKTSGVYHIGNFRAIDEPSGTYLPNVI